MDFEIVVKRRRMVRSFLDTPVPDAVIERILSAAISAPTAGNAQGVHFVVVTDKAKRAEIADAADEASWVAKGYRPWLSVAPVHIVMGVRLSDYHNRYDAADKAASVPPPEWAVPFWWFDAGAAFEAVLLAAANEGLAAGFQGAQNVSGLAEIVGWTAIEPAGVITIGHEHHAAPTGSAVTVAKREDRVVWIRE